MKTCTHCHLELPLDRFGAHARRRDGRNNICRPCAADRQRADRATEHGRAVAAAAVRRSRERARSGVPSGSSPAA